MLDSVFVPPVVAVVLITAVIPGIDVTSCVIVPAPTFPTVPATEAIIGTVCS